MTCLIRICVLVMSQLCLKPLTSHLVNDMPRGMFDMYPTNVQVFDTQTLHPVDVFVLPWSQSFSDKTSTDIADNGAFLE